MERSRVRENIGEEENFIEYPKRYNRIDRKKKEKFDRNS